jgi:integrase
VFVRPSQLRLARWNKFDLKRGIWEIPDTRPALDAVPFFTLGTKWPETFTLYLSLHAVSLLEQIHRPSGKFDLVFAGDAKPWKPMSENTVNAALRTMGYDTKVDICGHGFRAMACSVLIESGLWSETTIERQMSHKERNNVRAAYIHKAEFLEERRMIMTCWNRPLEANREDHVTPHEFAKQAGGNVTRIRSAKRT